MGREDDPRNHRNHHKGGFRRGFFRFYQQINAIRDRETKKAQSTQEHKTRWVNAIATTAATVGIMFAAIATAVVGSYQWQAIRGQADIMEADQRPWVGFEVTSQGGQPGQSFTVQIVVKNAGKSPALNVRAGFRTKPLKFNSEDDEPECGPNECSEVFLLPGGTANFAVVMPGENTKLGGSPFGITGRVDYEDTSGNEYWTRICRVYTPIITNLGGCSRGNDAGEKHPHKRY